MYIGGDLSLEVGHEEVTAVAVVCNRCRRPCHTCEGSTRCQFHQHFTQNFFVQKYFAQLLSTYILALKFFGERISVQKLLKKCWWNWKVEIEAQNKAGKIGKMNRIGVDSNVFWYFMLMLELLTITIVGIRDNLKTIRGHWTNFENTDPFSITIRAVLSNPVAICHMWRQAI